MSPRTSTKARPKNNNGTSRHAGGRRRSRAAALTPATRSSMVAFAISDGGVRRHPVARGDRRQRDHLHGVVAEADSLKGDAVHRAMVLTNPAAGTAGIVDQD